MPLDNLLLWNCTGLNDRLLPELRQFIFYKDIAVAVFVETHISEQRKPAFIPNMSVHYSNHTAKSSGVAIYTSNQLFATDIPALSCAVPHKSSKAILLSVLLLNLRRPANDPILLTAAYIPPGVNNAVAQQITA